MSTEERAADRKMDRIRTAGILVISSHVIQLVSFLLVCFEVIRLYPSKKVDESTLQTMQSRVEFAFRYQILLVLWLLINIFATIFARVKSAALNPLERDTEAEMAGPKNILTNSFEQVILSFLGQLVFIAYADPIHVLKYIPLINVLMFFGRIAFLLGYPMKRGLGFFAGFTPSIIMIIFGTYKFLGFLLF